MTDVVDVLVPCERLQVTARVGPEDHLTDLETLVMRAIDRGVETIPDIASVFGLGQRLALDLVFDLWRTGLVLVDVTRGRVGLSQVAQDAVANDSFAELSSTHARDQRLEVLQDQLTGHVLDPRGVARPEMVPRAIVPVAMFDVGPQDVSRDRLVEALRTIVRRDGDTRQPRKVLSADLAWDNLKPQQDRRHLRIRVRPAIDEASSQLKVDVLPDPQLLLPARVRTQLAERIALVVEAEPEHDFSRWLLGEAERRTPLRTDARAELRKLSDRIDRLEPSPAFLPEHDELRELAESVAAHAGEPVAPTFDIALVDGREEQLARLHDVINRADRQLVIASPWLRSNAVNALVEPLEAAIVGGVEVFVVWGIAPADELAPDERVAFNLLAALAKAFPGRLHISRRSASSHAKIAIADDRVALVTSRNLLSGRHQSEELELGVLVSAHTGQACSLIEDLLRWTRETIPDYVHGQAVLQHAEDFVHAAVPDARAPRAVAPAPSPPDTPGWYAEDDVDPSFHEALLDAWVSSWRSHIADLRSFVEKTERGAGGMVRDGEHRDVLWDGLRTAKRRLLVLSDKLAAQVVDHAWVATLADRLEDGVAVALVWSRTTDEEPVTALRELQRRADGRLILVPDAPNHAKAVVADDRLTIGSFNFLSFEGMYREPMSPGWRRERKEVSVQFCSRELSDRTIAAVAAACANDLRPLLQARAPVVEPPPAGRRAEPQPAGLETLIPALARTADAWRRHVELRTAFAASEEPWRLLEALHASPLPASVVRMATATFVTAGVDDERTTSWRRWLVVDAWRRNALLEAAVITESLPEPPPEVIAPTVTACWALLGHGEFGSAITDAALETERDEDIRALVAVAVVALIVHGDPAAAEVLEAHSTRGPWQTLADLALAHWQSTFTSVPMRMIREEVGAAADRETQDRSRDVLLAALDDADRDFLFKAGRTARAALFAEDGVLGTLRAVAVANDESAIRTWVTDHRATHLGELLDEASAGAGEAIHGGPRRTYLARLRTVWDAAEQHVVALGAAPHAFLKHVPPSLVDLAHGVREQWTALEADAESDHAAGPLCAALLPQLDPLRTWQH